VSRLRIGMAVAIGVGLLAVAVIALLKGENPSPQPATAVARSVFAAVEPPRSESGTSTVKASLSQPQQHSWAPSRRQPAVPEATDDIDADEASIMAELRELRSSDPRASLALAREGNESFPDSQAAPERVWFEARALVDLHRFDEAQAVARNMVLRYPGTHWTLDVQRHLLTHPFGLPPRYH